MEGSQAWSAYWVGCWPAVTRLHVDRPTAGVEVSWVGLSGK